MSGNREETKNQTLKQWIYFWTETITSGSLLASLYIKGTVNGLGKNAMG